MNLQTKFAAKSYLLKVSVAQSACLLLFDQQNTDTLTIAELLQGTNLTEDSFKSAMLNLCKPKVKLLLKEVQKPVFTNKDERISINRAFQNQKRLIPLLPTMEEDGKARRFSAKENQVNAARIARERANRLQVACVKIMKAR